MSGRDDGPVGRREVAYRMFAAVYEDADLEYSDSDAERAPNYVVTPTGARVNRLFTVGVLTEVEPVSDDVLRARVVDPTGAFVVYAGQYQPEAVAFLEGADVPSFVAVTGKARTFQPEGSDRVFTSIRPEAITAVDAATRDGWTVQAAEHTLARVATMARAIARDERGDELTRALESAGVAPGLASGIAVALDHYGTTTAYLSAVRELAVAATEVVAGDRESVPELDIDPSADGPVTDDLSAAHSIAGILSADRAEDVPAEPAVATAEPAPDAVEEPLAVVSDSAATADEPDVADSVVEPAATGDDDLGDFEAQDIVTDATADAGAADELYELDEAEREEVEAEFGTEFSTGSEVGEPGEAGLDADSEPPATAAAEPDADSPETGEQEESQPTAETEPAAEPDATDVDLEDATVEAMAELDDGDGAKRTDVVEAVVEAKGADPQAVEQAIQDALMDGRCYEPADGRLKAI